MSDSVPETQQNENVSKINLDSTINNVETKTKTEIKISEVKILDVKLDSPKVLNNSDGTLTPDTKPMGLEAKIKQTRQKKIQKHPFELTGPVIKRIGSAGGHTRLQTRPLYEKINEKFSEKCINILNKLLDTGIKDFNLESFVTINDEILKYDFKKLKHELGGNCSITIVQKQTSQRETKKEFIDLLIKYNIENTINPRTLEYHLDEIKEKLDVNNDESAVIEIVNVLKECQSNYNKFIAELKPILKEKKIKFKLNEIYSEDYEKILNNLDNLDQFRYNSITTKSLIYNRDHYTEDKDLLFSPFNTFHMQLVKYLQPHGIKVRLDFSYHLLYNLERYILYFFTSIKDIVDHTRKLTVTIDDFKLFEKIKY